MKFGKIINVSLSLVIPSLLYTYYYPWLYNKVNSYTQRGPNLNDEIYFLNLILTFLVSWVLISLFVISIMTPLIIKKKK